MLYFHMFPHEFVARLQSDLKLIHVRQAQSRFGSRVFLRAHNEFAILKTFPANEIDGLGFDARAPEDGQNIDRHILIQQNAHGLPLQGSPATPGLRTPRLAPG